LPLIIQIFFLLFYTDADNKPYRFALSVIHDSLQERSLQSLLNR